MRRKRPREEHRPYKLGTMPRYAGWITIPVGGFEVGKIIEYREMLGEKFQQARIWKIGPPPEYLLYLEAV